MANRFGQFMLAENAVLNNPEQAFEVLQRMAFVPLRVGAASNHQGMVVYAGISKLFNLVDESEKYPRYNIVIEHSDEGIQRVEAQLIIEDD